MASRKNKRSGQKSGSDGNRSSLKAQFSEHRTYTIPDLRLEKPSFTIRQIRKGDEICYEVEGNLNTSVPPIRESKYLSKQQHIEIYRWMLLNRKMEQALENLYKQGKVVGGVYFGLGQEACSCASAFALRSEEHTSELQSQFHLVCRLLLEKKKKI